VVFARIKILDQEGNEVFEAKPTKRNVPLCPTHISCASGDCRHLVCSNS
jgi:hypothetical protein